MDINKEIDLIKKAKKDPNAFAELFDHYYPIIYGFVLKRVASIELAQDITSDVFFESLKNLWRYRFFGKPFGTWLYRIAFVKIADYYRNKSRLNIGIEFIPEIIANQSFNADNEIIENQDISEVFIAFNEIHLAMSNLKSVQHGILVMRYFEDKKINEIAQILGMKESTVKSHIRRGLKKLESILKQSKNFGLNEYVKERIKFTFN